MTGNLRLWAAWLAAEGTAAGTVRLYQSYVGRLAAAHPLDVVTADELVMWLAGQSWGPSTRKSARTAVRSYFGWAVRRGLRPDDPSTDVGAVRQPAPCPRPAADAAFMRACQQATREELLMVLLGASCGLRRAEIAGLHTDMVSGGEIRVTGKGGRTRLVPVVNEDLARMLAECPEGWLFPGRWDGPVTPDYVGRRLSRLLGPGWTAHSLRHRYATSVYAGSRDVLALQDLLGHSSPETTRRYVDVGRQARWDAARHAA